MYDHGLAEEKNNMSGMAGINNLPGPARLWVAGKHTAYKYEVWSWLPRFELGLSHLLVLWLWTNYLTNLGLTFLIWKNEGDNHSTDLIELSHGLSGLTCIKCLEKHQIHSNTQSTLTFIYQEACLLGETLLLTGCVILDMSCLLSFES